MRRRVLKRITGSRKFMVKVSILLSLGSKQSIDLRISIWYDGRLPLLSSTGKHSQNRTLCISEDMKIVTSVLCTQGTHFFFSAADFKSFEALCKYIIASESKVRLILYIHNLLFCLESKHYLQQFRETYFPTPCRTTIL